MSSPTKADLTAAVAKLTEENRGLRDENAALRELLGAARAYADLPHPADYSSTVYAYECERRLDGIAVWANGDQEDMDPGVYLLVIGDRAGHLREEAAKPVRYEVRAEPAPAAVPGCDCVASPPRHATLGEPACTAPGYDDRASGYVCTAQDGHDGPDHIAYKPDGGEYHRWPVASGTPLLVDDEDAASVTA